MCKLRTANFQKGWIHPSVHPVRKCGGRLRDTELLLVSGHDHNDDHPLTTALVRCMCVHVNEGPCNPNPA